MSNERLGIVEECQRTRALYGHKLYRAPVPSVASAYHIVVDLRQPEKRTITRLNVPKVRAVRIAPAVRPPLPRPPRRKTNFSGRIEREIDRIITACVEAYGVSAGELVSVWKPNRIARPRFAVVRLLRARLRLSYPQIGQIIGRDHTSVLAAFARCRELRISDLGYRHGYATAVRILRGVQQ